MPAPGEGRRLRGNRLRPLALWEAPLPWPLGLVEERGGVEGQGCRGRPTRGGGDFRPRRSGLIRGSRLAPGSHEATGGPLGKAGWTSLDSPGRGSKCP